MTPGGVTTHRLRTTVLAEAMQVARRETLSMVFPSGEPFMLINHLARHDVTTGVKVAQRLWGNQSLLEWI